MPLKNSPLSVVPFLGILQLLDRKHYHETNHSGVKTEIRILFSNRLVGPKRNTVMARTFQRRTTSATK